MALRAGMGVACLASVLVAAVPARAAPQDTPVVGAEVARGVLRISDAKPDPSAAAVPRRADGDISDWVGRRTGFAGTATYSRGEYLYEDHIWDAYGAQSPDDAVRTTALDTLAAADPDAYRAEAVALYLPDSTAYGAGPLRYEADLVELRVAARRDTVSVLARTTLMTAAEHGAVLLLADTTPGSVPRNVPFGSGITTSVGDVALLLAGDNGTAVDLATGTRRTFPVASQPAGYVNAIEAEIPRALVAGAGPLRLAAATGGLDAVTGELAGLSNVAFRQEPMRPVFDKRQARALHDGTIDPFFAEVDLGRLGAGVTQAVTPGPGYHDRITISDEAISREQGPAGIHQHSGLYIPPGLDRGRPVPATLFLHGSGNDAHDLPAVMPGLVRALGDRRGGVVIAPQGRTDLSLWEGAGLQDVLEAWDDAARTVRVDRRRTAIAGYSMGGLGAYLLAGLYPDRFASAFSIAGPVGGDVVSPGMMGRGLPDVRRLFANLRWVPTAIYQGGADNNVPITNGRAAASTLDGFGYRHRLFEFPADNHFSPGAVDRWEAGIDYVRRFSPLDPDPPAVTYVRDMAFERTVNTAEYSDQEHFPPGGHRFRFDGAYWLDELTAVDQDAGVARADVRSAAIRSAPIRSAAEHGTGTRPDPFVWSGRAWTQDGATPPRANRFTAALRGASAIRLDTRRMGLDERRTIRGTLTTSHPLELRLTGRWGALPVVRLDGRHPSVRRDRRGIVINLREGRHVLSVAPTSRPASRRLRRSRPSAR